MLSSWNKVIIIIIIIIIIISKKKYWARLFKTNDIVS